MKRYNLADGTVAWAKPLLQFFRRVSTSPPMVRASPLTVLTVIFLNPHDKRFPTSYVSVCKVEDNPVSYNKDLFQTIVF